MIRVLLVDDEQPARDRLRTLLADFDDIDIVGEAADGVTALAKIADLRPDLVFLDIQMPELDGLQVISSLTPPRPRVIFCTAYDEFAVDAFEHHAIDYLLKPLRRDRLAQAIDRLRQSRPTQRMEREIEAASRAQAYLLRQRSPASERLDLCGSCRPAREIGGDWYDFLAVGEHDIGIAVGDVAGKGLYAGLLMAAFQARLQTLAPRFRDDVAAMMRELNRVMSDATESNRYATAFYGVLDESTGRMRFVNAGLEPPLLMRRGTLERLDRGGPALGMLDSASYDEGSVQLEPEDVVAIFSDGITDAADASDETFGRERFERLLLDHRELPASDLHDLLLDRVREFRGTAAQSDDETLVVARVR